MRVDVLTLFPEAFEGGPLDVSIIKRAREDCLLDLQVHNIRDHATDRHRSVDDTPFGGGQGRFNTNPFTVGIDREVSIGDYIVTGGELPAMVLIDAVARHIPGALGDEVSPEEESFADGLLEHPQYTRPAEYNGWAVPEILLSGHHAKIEKWKQEQRLERTRERRPDLLGDSP